MTPDQITEWVHGGESETLEFKRSTGERRTAMHTLCAMLNNRGGRVLFGVSPEGKIPGQQIGDTTIEEIVQEIGEIEPPVFPNVDRVPLANGREVLVVTATQGPVRPYSYRGAGISPRWEYQSGHVPR